jgi:hypothetical protein
MGSGRADLERLTSLRTTCGPDVAAEKARLIRSLARRSLGSADEVLGLHETLVFVRAFPDDRRVRAAADEALAGFAHRADVRRFRNALADSGVAGTRMSYAFSFPMARWLTRRDPAGARIAWDDWEREDDLDDLLPALASPAEMPGVDDETLSGREWIENACPDGAGDAATLVSRIERIASEPRAREHLYNQLEVPLTWELGESPDSRSLARWPVPRTVYSDRSVDTRRPKLAAAIREAPRIRRIDERTAAGLIDLARGTMSVRLRELEAFDYGDPRDAFLVDAGRGLLISLIGLRPEWRLFPESLYAGLFIRNGVPAGYWLASALFETSEIAYNVFPTFRGGDAAWMYGRLLAMLHSFLGVVTFTVPRYQIGHENDEAIGSGAFWFYRKLGLSSVDPDVRRQTRKEEALLRRRPGSRSSPETLRRLVVENLVFHLEEPREEIIGIFPYANLGHQVTRLFARRGGRSPAVERKLAAEAAEKLGARGMDRWTADERKAFRAWAPVVLLLPGLGRWGRESKRRLVKAIRAKGGRHEAEFVRLSNGHAPLRRGIQKLCRTWDGE